LTDEPFRQAAYEAKLEGGQTQRWAGAYRTSRGRKKHPILQPILPITHKLTLPKRTFLCTFSSYDPLCT